jgi:urease accessory protein
MILTKALGNAHDVPHLDSYHVETAMVKSDDLLKRILRVKTDHGNSYGIRLDEGEPTLEAGTVFDLGDGNLLMLSVIPDEVMIITPGGIDQMGRIAHMLGNLHKPVQVADGTITLLRDPVVEDTLREKGVAFVVEKRQLTEAMRYADLTHHHYHHEHEHHHDHDHHHDHE